MYVFLLLRLNGDVRMEIAKQEMMPVSNYTLLHDVKIHVGKVR